MYNNCILFIPLFLTFITMETVYHKEFYVTFNGTVMAAMNSSCLGAWRYNDYWETCSDQETCVWNETCTLTSSVFTITPVTHLSVNITVMPSENCSCVYNNNIPEMRLVNTSNAILSTSVLVSQEDIYQKTFNFVYESSLPKKVMLQLSCKGICGVVRSISVYGHPNICVLHGFQTNQCFCNKKKTQNVCAKCGANAASNLQTTKCICKYGFYRHRYMENVSYADCLSVKPTLLIVRKITSTSIEFEWKIVEIFDRKIEYVIRCDDCEKDGINLFPIVTRKEKVSINCLESGKFYLLSVYAKVDDNDTVFVRQIKFWTSYDSAWFTKDGIIAAIVVLTGLFIITALVVRIYGGKPMPVEVKFVYNENQDSKKISTISECQV